jgi:hypothetical protein
MHTGPLFDYESYVFELIGDIDIHGPCLLLTGWRKMKYLLIEPKVKAKAPNIALLKWARWCEMHGHEYQYIRGCVEQTKSTDIALISCLFSYFSKKYEKTIDHYLKRCDKVIVGGVFPTLNPQWFNKIKWNNHPLGLDDRLSIHCGIQPEIENLIPKYDVDIISEDPLPYKQDRIVLYASRGCVNRCGYCAVPKLEGNMKSFRSIKDTLEAGRKELPNAKSVVLYDNNFTEHKYFDDIIQELVDFGLPVDIHGLHVDSFDEHKAKQFARLKWASQSDSGTPYLRFSFDKLSYRDNIEKAYKLILEHKIKATLFLYLLYNYHDTPQDFFNRILACQEMVDRHNGTIIIFPQQYIPIDALDRKHISNNWTKESLKGVYKLREKLRNFLWVNNNKTMINDWIGNSVEDFLERWTPEQLAGVKLLYTHIHGFIPLTMHHTTLDKWIGNSHEEFLDRIREKRKTKEIDSNEIEKIESSTLLDAFFLENGGSNDNAMD